MTGAPRCFRCRDRADVVLVARRDGRATSVRLVCSAEVQRVADALLFAADSIEGRPLVQKGQAR